MGLKGYHITATEELIPTLKDALAQDIPAVIDCPVGYSENMRFSRKVGELSCPI